MKKPEVELFRQLDAIDKKTRRFYGDLSSEEQKSVSPYLLMKYAASATGSADLAAYYLQATNENVNVNFWLLSKLPELQWLTITTVSPDLGKQRHYWLKTQKKSSEESKFQTVVNKCKTLLPEWKERDIELWVQLNGLDAVNQWVKEHGES